MEITTKDEKLVIYVSCYEDPVIDKAETWSEPLQTYVDCTELFKDLYRTKGYWHDFVFNRVVEGLAEMKEHRGAD